MQIPTYKSEINDGLSDLIQASASFGILSDPIFYIPSEPQKSKIEELLAVGRANPDQLDLYYLKSILTSVGWNKNDDVFDSIETWHAKTTAVDKPFNLGHNPRDIIGHITSASVIDKDGKVVVEDTSLESLPEVFDVIVGSVLYRSLSDLELKERMDKIIDEIPTGKWKVSMECLFKNFDYALIAPDGKKEVLKRTEASSFLTKYLRIYGGNGEYDGYRIGRLLRNFTFSGKGLVEKPANPRSTILSYSDKSEVESFVNAVEADISNFNKKETVMSDVITYTQEQYEFLKKELDEVKAELVKRDSTIADLQQKMVTFETEKSTLESVKNAVVIEKDSKISSLEKRVAELETSSAELQKQLDEIEVEAVKAIRLARLMERDVTEENAKNLVEKFTDASDEMFDSIVNALPGKREELTDDQVANDATKALDSVRVNSGVVPIEPVNDDDKVLQSVASWLGDNVLPSAKRK